MAKVSLNSVGKAEELISIAINDEQRTNEERVGYLYDLVDGLLDEEKEDSLNGDADDFHNFGVAILNVASDYETALDIVQCGLKIHFANTDLLADAIRYGYNCGKYEKCEQWYNMLMSISKKLWTWRAFSFSIDYLLDMMGMLEDHSEEAIHNQEEKIFELVQEYQTYYPDEEDSLVSEFQFYNATNQMEKGIEVLEKANRELKLCPKCWLRYADIMVERGEYEKAEPMIKKLRSKPDSATSINFAYVYYLDGLCKLTRLLEDELYPEEEVRKAYKAFTNALKHRSLSQNTKSKIMQQMEILELESEMECPYNYNL